MIGDTGGVDRSRATPYHPMPGGPLLC